TTSSSSTASRPERAIDGCHDARVGAQVDQAYRAIAQLADHRGHQDAVRRPVPHLPKLVVAWPRQLYLAGLQWMLERNHTTRPSIGGERDAPDERRALGVLPGPGGLVGARALDEQAEGRRVRIRRNRYELHVRRRRTFPMSDGDGLDEAHSPGVAGEEGAGAIPRG